MFKFVQQICTNFWLKLQSFDFQIFIIDRFIKHNVKWVLILVKQLFFDGHLEIPLQRFTFLLCSNHVPIICIFVSFKNYGAAVVRIKDFNSSTFLLFLIVIHCVVDMIFLIWEFWIVWLIVDFFDKFWIQ